MGILVGGGYFKILYFIFKEWGEAGEAAPCTHFGDVCYFYY